MSAQSIPKTETERNVAKQKAQQTYYKLMAFVPTVRSTDAARWKMWQDIHSALVGAISPYPAPVAGDDQGLNDVNYGFNRLSNGMNNLNAAIQSPQQVSTSSALQLFEHSLYVIPLYRESVFNKISEILDLAAKLPISVISKPNQSTASAPIHAPLIDAQKRKVLSDMTAIALRDRCRANGLPTTGLKNDLVERLLALQA